MTIKEIEDLITEVDEENEREFGNKLEWTLAAMNHRWGFNDACTTLLKKLHQLEVDKILGR